MRRGVEYEGREQKATSLPIPLALFSLISPCPVTIAVIDIERVGY